MHIEVHLNGRVLVCFGRPPYDHFVRWFENRVIFDPAALVLEDDLFDDYNDWCRRHFVDVALSEHRFADALAGSQVNPDGRDAEHRRLRRGARLRYPPHSGARGTLKTTVIGAAR